MPTLTTEEFFSNWSARYRELAPGFPFWPSRWHAILRPYSFPRGNREADAILAAARQGGARELVVSDTSTIPPHQFSAVLGVDSSLSRALDQLTLLRQFDCTILANSGAWALFCANDEEFSCFAGERRFVQAFTESLGGEGTVKLEFARYYDDWPLSISRKEEILEGVSWSF